jgi:hypothetical protein
VTATIEREQRICGCGCGCGEPLPPEFRRGTTYLNEKHRDRVKKRRDRAAARAARLALVVDPTPPFSSTETTWREAEFCECDRPIPLWWAALGSSVCLKSKPSRAVA